MFRHGELVERAFGGRFVNPVTMLDDTQDRTRQKLKDALHHLQSALDLLDRAGAPGQIGAHVDLAIHQLSGAMPMSGTPERQCDAGAKPALS